jgi:transposase
MPRMVVSLQRRVKLELRRLRRGTKDKGLYKRCQMILLAGRGRPRAMIAEALGCSVSGVDRVLRRFREDGMAGLIDHREDNGQVKLDEYFLAELYELVDGSPQDYGYPRPTWTQELFCLVMEERTGVRVHRGTMSLALQKIRSRLGNPKPTVECPWPKRRKNCCLRAIEAVVQSLRPREVAVYLDEVDIHLNPKIGPDWMNRGKQKTVPTPGQNVKRYIAGALDTRTGEIAWVQSDHKNSLLVIAMFKELIRKNPQATKIHVILDNFKIHDSKATRAAMESFGGKIILHFLPPYCPDHNRIERTWRDLHDNVTRNHKCRSIEELMKEVVEYIIRRNRNTRAESKRAAA